MPTIARSDLAPLLTDGYTVNHQLSDAASFYFLVKQVAKQAVRVVLTDDEQVDVYVFDVHGRYMTTLRYQIEFKITTPASVVLATIKAIEEAISQ